MDVVRAAGLSRNFGEFRAVKEINFSIREGECYGFLGPNGAGKTTTIRMIQAFLPRSGGALSVMGRDVDEDPAWIKARMGVCPQENTLDRDLSVRQNLLTYARYFGIPSAEAGARAEELLQFLQLEGRRDAKLSEISGGMQRRLAIARSLINNPALLILDEPTTGLDPQARHMIWRRLLSLKSGGVTMILTTHYMEEAERLCDRVAIMNDGRILMEGPPSALVKSEIGDEVIEARIDDSGMGDFLSEVKEMKVSYERHGDTIYIYCRGACDVMSSVLKVGHKSALHRKANLEDLFLRLAGRSLNE